MTCNKWFQINRAPTKKPLAILQQHLLGVSYRNLGYEHGIDASTAYRRSTSALDKLMHCADISRRFCNRYCGILLVDGKYIAIKGYDRKIPVLYGIDYLTHDIPHYVLSVSENYSTCHSFFTSLRLLNYPLQAVVSDDNKNIYESCLSVYPKAITQLCQNHYKQSLRLGLNVGQETTYQPFMKEIEFLFAKRRSKEEFTHLAAKVYLKHKHDPICASVMVEMQKRLPQLLAYTQVPQTPTTNNLIESFNSHLEGRLKTIKGFESFKHADTWLNAYFVKRRIKPFTDCEGKFKNLNGKCSLELALKPYYQIDTLLKLLTWPFLQRCGGADGTRTRDLLRDRQAF